MRTRISANSDLIPLGFLHAPSRSFQINLIQMPKRSKHSLNQSLGPRNSCRFSFPQETPTRNSTPPFFYPKTKLAPNGRFAALLSGTVLLFAAEHTPHKLWLQVLFSRNVLRMNQVVLDLLTHSTLAPTAAGAVSSVFAAALRRVLGVSRLNCLIL